MCCFVPSCGNAAPAATWGGQRAGVLLPAQRPGSCRPPLQPLCCCCPELQEGLSAQTLPSPIPEGWHQGLWGAGEIKWSLKPPRSRLFSHANTGWQQGPDGPRRKSRFLIVKCHLNWRLRYCVLVSSWQTSSLYPAWESWCGSERGKGNITWRWRTGFSFRRVLLWRRYRKTRYAA